MWKVDPLEGTNFSALTQLDLPDGLIFRIGVKPSA
jgi:hypothetical protein